MILKRTKQFEKDFKKIKFNDLQFQKFIMYISLLCENKVLPIEAKDHPLKGEWSEFREFHIGGDLLIIYLKRDNEIILTRIDTHSQLFKKF
jgi:mRNA interferase YafQ